MRFGIKSNLPISKWLQSLSCICVIASVSFGCQVGVLSKDQIDAMRTAPISLLHHANPPFLIMTERNMIPVQTGLVQELFASAIRGPNTPEDLGNAAQAEERLLDPAIRLQHIVAQTLQKKWPMAKIHEVQDAQAKMSPAQIRKITDSDLVLAIRTTSWGLWPYAFDTSFHSFKYKGELSLIDLRKSSIVWSTDCQYLGDAPKNSRPSIEDFQQEHAALLKAELNRASETCAEQLLEQLQM